jgi:putative hydrolase of the HAD superfamily
MSETLGYQRLFDHEFYSCELGVHKPDPNYFTTLLDSLRAKPDEILFVDDNEANVAAAVSVGIRSELFLPPQESGPAQELRRILKQNGVLD